MKKLIVLTGAGISAESGLKTFRDYDGLWENHRIEEVATPNAWKSNPQLVLDFYNHRRKEAEKALPNAAHLGLVLLEKYYDIHIITQNVDNLHEKAGSQNILHLHGSLFSKCSDKDRGITAAITEDIALESIAPDGGYWRPDIVWFGENVDNYEYATTWMQDAAIVVVIGTSLQVYPAAGLVTLAPYATPVYIIDPNMDKFINQFTTIIPKAATEGIKDLIITLMPNLSETVNF
jgi:NAD-dependent deacetylase